MPQENSKLLQNYQVKAASDGCFSIRELNFISNLSDNQRVSFQDNFFFSELLVVQRQTFCRHLGEQSKKDIQIFNRFHSIRLCGRTSMTPQRYLIFLFMFFFFSDLQFFPEHTQLNFAGGTSSVSTL